MGLLVAVLLFALSVLLHELGHLAGALLVGWKPIAITWGKPDAPTRFRTGDLHWKLGFYPFSGSVFALARSPRHFRLKYFIHVAAGPLVTLAISVSLFYFLMESPYTFLYPKWVQQAASDLLIAESLLLFICMIPFKIVHRGKVDTSDGNLMLTALTMKASDIAQHFWAHQGHLLDLLLKEHRIDEATQTIKEAQASNTLPHDSSAYFIHLLLQYGFTSEARSQIDTLYNSSTTSSNRIEILDALASLPVFHGHMDLLEESLRYINEAIAIDPDKITLKGTKGSLLIEQGNLEAGQTMLQEVIQTSTAEMDQAICAYYIALVSHRKSDPATALTQLQSAITLAPNNPVRQRIESEIKSPVDPALNP